MVAASAPVAVRDCSWARNASGAVCVRPWAAIRVVANTAVASTTMAADSGALWFVIVGLMLLRDTAQPDDRGAVVFDQERAVRIDADLRGGYQFARHLSAIQLQHGHGHFVAGSRRRLGEPRADEQNRLGGHDRHEPPGGHRALPSELDRGAAVTELDEARVLRGG